MEMMAQRLGASFSPAETMHGGLRVFYVHVRKRCVMAVYSDAPGEAFRSSELTDMAREMIDLAVAPWLARFHPVQRWSSDAKEAQAQVLDALWAAFRAHGELAPATSPASDESDQPPPPTSPAGAPPTSPTGS